MNAPAPPQPGVAVVLTAIPVEYRAIVGGLERPESRIAPSGSIYTVGLFQGLVQWHVAVVQNPAGNTQAALATLEAINDLDPDLLIFSGVAGGVKNVGLGDVVVADKIYAYERGKAKDGTFWPRPLNVIPRRRVIEHALRVVHEGNWIGRTEHAASKPQAVVGTIAAGEKVVADEASEIAEMIKKVYGETVAIEMEGYGFLEAARFKDERSALVVRGISDMLGDKTEAHDARWQAEAAANAAAFSFEFLASLDPGYLAGLERMSPDRTWATILPPRAEATISRRRPAGGNSTDSPSDEQPDVDVHVLESILESTTSKVGQVPPNAGPASSPIGEGYVLAGRFSLVAQVGLGVAGAVYSAMDNQSDSMDALAAVKLAWDSRSTAGIKNELDVLTRLDFPKIMPLLDHGNLNLEGATATYIAMPLADGALSDAGKLSLVEARMLLRDISEALNYLQGVAGIVHGDVKPSNILRFEQGWVLSDFGLASIPDTQQSLQGTPLYMPPERFRQGVPIGYSADVWSLGRTLLACLSDPSRDVARPLVFSVSENTRIDRSFAGQPSVPADLPPEWSVLLKKMISLDPVLRPTAGEILDGIDRLETE